MNRQEIITHIIKNTDIYDLISKNINLKPKGRDSFVGLCPFHEDTNPSLSVSLKKQIFKCFSCQKSGNIINFVMLLQNLNFLEALQFLDKEYNLKLKLNYTTKLEKNYSKDELQALRAFENAVSIYLVELIKIFSLGQQNLIIENPIFFQLFNFLKSRGITREIIEKFKIGFVPTNSILKKFLIDSKFFDDEVLMNYSLLTVNGNDFFQKRLVFPIENFEGKVVGFSGRCLDDKICQPKYLNSSSNSLFSKTEILYNYANAIKQNPKEIIITEGFFDVIAFYKAGIQNAVALMGTTLTKKHCEMLNNFTVLLALDSDKAGVEASLKSGLILGQNRINTYILTGFEGKDPDEYFNTFGSEALVNTLSNRINSFDFAYDFYKNSIKNNSSEEIKIFIEKFSPFLEILYHQNLQLAQIFFKKIKEDFGVSQDSFKFRPSVQHYNELENTLKENDDQIKSIHIKKTNNLWLAKPISTEIQELKILSQVLDDILYDDGEKYNRFKGKQFKFLNPLNNKLMEEINIFGYKSPKMREKIKTKLKEVNAELENLIFKGRIEKLINEDLNWKKEKNADDLDNLMELIQKTRGRKDADNIRKLQLDKEMNNEFVDKFFKKIRGL